MKTRAEQLVDKMLDEYPYGVFAVDTAFEFIENGGQVDITAFRLWMEAEGYWRSYFEEEPDEVLSITHSQIPEYLVKYNVSDVEELEDYLWYDCGIALKITD